MEKFQDDTVKLEMIKTILDGGYFNDNIYLCKMIKYNEEEECIYLVTGKTELSEFSLDSIYECTMTDEEEEVKCRGKIVERYWDKRGKVLVFHVENGFYKNTVN